MATTKNPGHYRELAHRTGLTESLKHVTVIKLLRLVFTKNGVRVGVVSTVSEALEPTGP